MTRLYLIRHARPAVSNGTCYGSTDLPVDETHQEQVLTHLLSVLPARAPVFCSPLRRCRGLAAGLARVLADGESLVDARLAEMDFGAWEMQAWDVIPRPEIDAWAADLPAYRPGGGESLLEVAGRVRSFYDDLRKGRHEHAVIVAHAGTIRLLLAAAQAGSTEEMVAIAAARPNRIGYGELTTIG